MEEPLISVIVPVYNVEKYLNNCIESIVNQTYKNLEIILVDDGSPDKCPEICDKWAIKDNRIKVIHKENGGRGDARNIGVSVSKGYYIGFVDGDDTIDKNMYKLLFDEISISDSDICMCLLKTITNESDYGYVKAPKDFSKDISISSDIVLREFFKNNNGVLVSFCNKLFKSSLLKNNTFPKLKYFEDWALAPVIYYNSKKISFINKYLYNYNLIAYSASRTENFERYINCVEADYFHYCFFVAYEKDFIDDIFRNYRSDFVKCILFRNITKDEKRKLSDYYNLSKKIKFDYKLFLAYHFRFCFKTINYIKNR